MGEAEGRLHSVLDKVVLQCHRGRGFLVECHEMGSSTQTPQPASREPRFALSDLSPVWSLTFLHDAINPLAAFLRKIPAESVLN